MNARLRAHVCVCVCESVRILSASLLTEILIGTMSIYVYYVIICILYNNVDNNIDSRYNNNNNM